MPVARLAHPLLVALLASTALVGIAPARAQGLPTGGQVVSGGVTIGTPQNGALAITQSSQNAIVNWQGFSIGQGNRVDIRQPDAQSAILNRVTGATPSTIAGQLTANGQVYLVNPNGITITRSGQVTAGGGFVASTLGISDEDFKAGRRQFRGSGASAKVTNHGTITVGRGGYAALIGGQVSNGGLIAVPMGKVGLGSGERATLDLSGDGFLQVAVPTGAKGRGALVSHSGTISADGGSVTLTAAAARDMARQAVNLSGTVEARSVSGRNGHITLSGGDGSVTVGAGARLDASGAGGEKGGRIQVRGRHVTVAGTLDASGARGGRIGLKATEGLALTGTLAAQGRTGPGGRVVATAPEMALSLARIDVSGATGGGVVRLGGGRQGAGRLAHAQHVTIDAGTEIRADATGAGTGGDVVVWSDASTRFAGTISARGGIEGGDGGQAEVSSKGHLAYEGLTDLTAAKGAFGTLLLDPYNITISSGTDSNPTGFTATGNDSVINSTTLVTALGSANVVVSTGRSGSQAGNITLAASTPLAWNTGATLMLQAARTVTLNSSITAQVGGLTIAAGTGTSTATADLSVARFILTSGAWVQNTATLPGFAAGDFQILGGSFLRAAGGAGTSESPYLLTDVYGLQGMGSAAVAQGASYRLAGDIDASGTVNWNQGQGFNPVGTPTLPFLGSLDGAGYTVAGLTIARPTMGNVGLIGKLAQVGTVSQIGLVGGSVRGSYATGGLVGFNSGTVSESYTTGMISGQDADTGGLVGYNTGTIDRSYATGTVTGAGNVGGLVGTNAGAIISQSYATGVVSNSAYNTGGLVGLNNGSVSQSSVSNSYATGSVSGRNQVGGLVGYNYTNGTIDQGYASGAVSGTESVGGLVGYTFGSVTNSYWDKISTGQATSAGGTGLTAVNARTASNYAGFDFSTVWYQAGDMRPILRSEAATADANGIVAVSNMHQLQLMGANLAGQYRLTANLDAGATDSTAASAGIWGAGGFVPVGTNANPVTGGLDGAGHTITGLTIARSQSYVGLIGYLGTGARVTGIGLVGGRVSGVGSVGGLVGWNNGGTVSQSYTTGSVSASGNSVGGLIGSNNGGTVSQSYTTGSVSASGNSVGGLIGYSVNRGTVSQSYATGSVSATISSVGGLIGANLTGSAVSQSYASGRASGNSFVGGLVGNNNGGTVSQSYATGGAAGLNTYVGGLVGFNSSAGSVNQSYATGSVSGASSVGGFVGFNQGGTLANSYWDITSGGATGVGGGSAGSVIGLTTAQARSSSAYTGFDFSTVWYQAGDMRPILRSEAATAVNGVTAVSNLHQLQLMGADLAGRYRLTTNIDAGATNSTAASAGIWGAGGFVPVGDGAPSFTGSLDGANRTITGLTIARPNYDPPTGLFGRLGLGSRVANLGLVDVNVTGKFSVGALAGVSAGAVNGSYATGTVSSSASYVGGLVGYLLRDASVSQSYANVPVSGTSNVGGLVGYIEGGATVNQSYAGGTVSGTSNVGGLVGGSAGMVSQTYASGAVSGTSNVGGLVGINYATVTKSYWDTQTSGQANGIGAHVMGSATGLTTAQMQDLAAFRTNLAGFDFDTVWAPPNQAGQGGFSTAFYPQLYASSAVVAVTPVSASRKYNTANPDFVATYAGLRPGDFITKLGTFSTSATQTSPVGTYAVTASGTAVTSPAGTAYRVVLVPNAAGLTIIPSTVTATASLVGSVSKTYDGTTAAVLLPTNYSLSGVAQADTAAVSVAGTGATFDSAGVGTGKTVTVSGLALSGTAAGNYVLAATTTSAAIGTITRAPLTITAKDTSKTYDGQAYAGGNGVSYTGLVNGETASVLGGSLIYGGTAQGAVNAGSYAIAPSGLTSGNYAVTFTNGALSVTKAPLTITAKDTSKIYDGQAYAGGNGVSYTGLVNGETASVLGGSLTYGGTAQGAVNAGSYILTPSGLTSGNYAVTFADGALTVGAKTLEVTIGGTAAKVYDGTVASGLGGLTYTLSGIVGTDAVTVAGTSGRYRSADVGTDKPMLVSGLTLSGAAAGNYQLANRNMAAPVGTILPAPLTITAKDASKTYDGQAYAGGNGVSYTGLVNGETASVLGGSLIYGGTAQGAVNAGSYVLAPSGLTSGNYAVTFADGALSVGKAPLTITAKDAGKTYDGQAYAGGNGISYTGFVNGETASVLGGSLTYGGTAQGAVNAGSYVLAPSGLTSGNYAVTFADGALSVGKAALTITAKDAGKTYDGQAYAGGNGISYTGLVNGETASVLGGSLTYGGTAQGAVNAGSYAIAPSGLTSGNYAVTFANGALSVTKAPLTITAKDAGKTYDGQAYAGGNGVSYTGLVNGETASVLGGSLTYGGTAQGAVNAGSYAIAPSGLTSGNYAVTFADGALSVTKAPLTITAKDAGKTYDGQAYAGGNGISYTGFVNGETASVLGGSLTYGGTAQGAVNAGSYAIAPSGLTSGNYAVTFADGALSVGKAPLTITANAASKTYDGQAYAGGNGVSYTGLVNGETGSVLGGSLTYGGTAQGAVNAGSYVLAPSGLTSGNYAVTFANGALSVNKAPLTITAKDATKTYDGQAYAGGNGVSYTGLVNGETASVLGGSLTYGGTAQGAVNAGSYVLTPSGLTSGNYAVTFADGALSVNKAPLTITAKDAGKTYDGQAYAGGNGVSYTGLVNGETASVLGGSLTYGGTAQGAVNAGSYVLAPSGLTSGNYAVTFADGALSVGKAPLTITANAASKTYDGQAYAGGNGISYTGFVNGETASVLGGSLTYGGTAQGAVNAGSYAIAPSGLTSGNYAVTFADGALSVGKAALTITAKDAGKTYDGQAYAGGNGISYTGLVNGETGSVLGGSLTYGGTAQGAVNAGSYAITPSGLTSGNYAVTFADGALSVGKAPLTITAKDATKTYDGQAYAGGNGVSYTGLVNGETASVLGGSLTYGGTAQGAVNAGSYAIAPSGLTSGNYAVTFADGALSVNKAALTITAKDATKTYDGRTFSGGTGVTYAGLVNGETASVLGGSLSYGGTAQGAVNAGSYALTPSGLTSGNYAVTFADGALNVGKAALTITAKDAGKTYDGQAFSGGNGASYAGFVNGETASVLGGSLSYGGAAQGAVNAGSYAITPSGLTSGNYAITFADGALNVGKAALTITAKDATKTYDGQAFSGGNGVTYAGFVNGETASVLGGSLSYGGTAQGAVNAGSYAITPSGLASGNYAITFAGSTLGVNQAALTITAKDATKTYDGRTFSGSNGVTYAGLVNGETASVLGGSLTYGGTAQGAVNAGSYAITPSGLTSGNYAITFADGALSVNKAPLTITAKDAGKTYDGQAFSGGNGVTYAGLVNGEGSSVLGGILSYGGTAQGAVNAGSYAITPSGLTSGNYAVTFADGALSVGKTPLTITANAASKTYDGQAYAGGNGVSYTGLVNGETASVLGGSLTYGGTAQGAVNAGSYVLTPSGLTSGNYAVTFADGALSVGKAPLTITAKDAGKTYDGQAYAGGNGVSYTGLVNGETGSVLGGSLTYGGTAQGAVNAGSYVLTPSGLTSGNYAVTFADGALSVNKAPLTITAKDAGKTYDGQAYAGGNGVSYTGLVNGETASVLGGSLTYGGTAQGAVNAGSYAIAPSGLTSGNYAVTFADGALSVGKAALTITAKDAGKTYDGQAYAGGNGVSYTGLVNGETASVLGGSLTYGGTAQGAVNAGSYVLTPSGLTSGNYAVTFADGALSVSKASLTASIGGAAIKTYDGTGAASTGGVTYGLSGLVGSDAVTVVGAAAAYDSTLVGTGKTVSVSGLSLSGAAVGNYLLAATTASAAIGTITRAPLTITAKDASKTYDGQAYAGGNGVSYTGLVNGETASVLGGSLTYGGTAQGAVNAGSYALTPAGLISGNYAITFADGALSIARRSIMVTADAQSRVYGDANPALTYQVGGRGLVNGDALNGALATTADARSSVGAYGIGQGSLAASGNYAVSYVGADLAVTARPLTLTADGQSRVYGDSNPALTYQAGGRGLVNGDALSGGLATVADARSSVGAYGIGQGSLAASGNYAVSYVGADLAVTARPLTLTADAQSRVYGDANPALTYQVGGRGLVNGDALTGVLATTADARSNVGAYAIGQGSLAASSNYAVSYVGADLAVTARPLTLTADAQSRVYGEANPALTYQVGGRGLVNGDALSGALATTADARSSVGAYGIGQGSLAASPNYAVSYVGADLAVTARPLTLTADAQSRVYGDANPALTYRVGGPELVNGDSLTGALATTADARSNVGAYGIGQGSLAASPNYAVSYVGADLAVTARPLTLTADGQSRVYGDANPALTYRVGGRGLVNGDALSGGLATVADARSSVGAYGIGQGSLAASGNYAVSYVGADLTVTARPLTLTADAQSRVYGDTNPALTYRVGGHGLVNGDALSGVLATTADARNSVGTYAIGQGSLAASGNYAVSYVGADLAVTGRPLTLTADAQSRVYGDTNPGLTYQAGGRGLVNGDALSGVLATTADARSSVGTYAIGQGSLAASSNYAVSYVGADLAVTARPLTLTADAQSRVYGEANPALTYQIGGRGLVNGDALSGVLATTANARSSVGTYGIGQ
ncbi:filamentous hemagglutinin N-terminal domain-containing protein, partial [Methylobacterium sp. DB0501]|uniref:MBG domain-containing protein n=2 Tax=Methylobacterium TaxID=407 RepID=UPI0013ED1A1D